MSLKISFRKWYLREGVEWGGGEVTGEGVNLNEVGVDPRKGEVPTRPAPMRKRLAR
ncbi:MAG: hypothetical protein GY820_20600 [Gammaproteobacteria bacterium]|nr:hypothetical protein [Gammaproteobacteria bacterium]